MGHVHIEAVVTGNTASRPVRFLVDTGATYTMLPETLGQDVGIALLDRPLTFTLANGTEITAQVGTISLELAGRCAATTAAVLPGDIEPLLGVEALEALGLRVDPQTGTLEPTRSRALLLVGALVDTDLIARFDRLDARLERIDGRLKGIDDRLEQTDARLLLMVDTLEAQTKLLLALDARMEAGFAALNGRVSRLSEMLTRGFTWRDEQMQEILARLEQLEEKVGHE